MIVVFGNSIAFGHNDTKGGWVKRLKKDFKIINKSISGEDTSGLLHRFKQELAEINPDKIIIALGINDSSSFLKKHQVPFDIFKENYQEIIDISRRYTDKIICIGLTYVDESILNPLPLNIGKCYLNKSVKKYDNAIKKIAQKNNLKYIYLFDLLDNTDLDDGLHPNTKGHEKIYKLIKKELKN